MTRADSQPVPHRVHVLGIRPGNPLWAVLPAL